MNVTVDQLVNGLTIYIENEIFPAVHGNVPWRMLAAGAAIVTFNMKGAAIVEKYIEMFRFDADNLNVNELFQCIEDSMAKYLGGELVINTKMFGEFAFNASDVQALKSTVINALPPQRQAKKP
jgi:hypothetical protein